MNDQPFDPARVNTMLRATWGLRRLGDEDARLDLVLGPDEGHDLELEKRLREAIGGPGDPWELAYRRHKPVEPLQFGAPDPSRVSDIRDDLERRLVEAGVQGAAAFKAFPAGWILIAHVLAHYLRAWAEEGDAIEILEIRDRVGMLECTITGSERVDRLAIWAKRQSYDRCQITGNEGEQRVYNWRVLTLSDDMHVLAQWDMKAVEEKMYPTSRYGDGGFGGTHPDIDPADWEDGS